MWNCSILEKYSSRLGQHINKQWCNLTEKRTLHTLRTKEERTEDKHQYQSKRRCCLRRWNKDSYILLTLIAIKNKYTPTHWSKLFQLHVCTLLFFSFSFYMICWLYACLRKSLSLFVQQLEQTANRWWWCCCCSIRFSWCWWWQLHWQWCWTIWRVIKEIFVIWPKTHTSAERRHKRWQQWRRIGWQTK